MKLIKNNSELYLTQEERDTLFKAATILEEIAEKMISVDWSLFDDDEFSQAADILLYFTKKPIDK